MASLPRLTRWLARGWRAVLVAALVAAVAGCVGMPDSGPVGGYGASQENTAPALQYVGPFVSGPGPAWTPKQIVQGFLDASANYPADAAIAKEYLVSSASKDWDPGWPVEVFNELHVLSQTPPSPAGRPGGQHAQVDVTGTVLAAFNGSGQGSVQYVSAQGQEPAPSRYQFNLVKVDGLWRISNPPRHYRLLAAADFPRVYKAQDLYFFDSQGQVNPLDQVLVPYSVFVPLGTSPEDLVTHLVQDLTQDPIGTWLQNAAVSAFPDKTTVLNVSIEGATATVNLGGAVAGATKQVLQQISAQLVWTIAGSAASPSAIQSIELEINGKPQTPPAPCGTGQSQSPVQKLAAYECYDPYPAAPASFYYAASGLAWSRCGSETQAAVGQIGPVGPVVGRGGVLRSQQCGSGGSVLARGPAAALPAQPRSLPAMSMAAVSPDGKYLALVSPNKGAVYVGPLSGAATSFSKTSRPMTGPVTALSWDRDDDLWVAQGGGITVLSADGKTQSPINQGEYVTGLSVAPDGVRIALIVRDGAQSELRLAAISRPQSASGGPKSSYQPPTIDQSVQLGPNLSHPDALTWYDADDLVVLDGTSSENTLWEVPVDGQQASEPDGVLQPGTVSITADSAANALVAGLSNGQLAISAGLYGPWQTLAGNGQDPAYPGLPARVTGDYPDYPSG